MSDLNASQVRIGRAGAADEIIGCGLLVTPRHLVTCAHVVAEALGVEETAAAPPAGEVPIDLPLLPHPFRTTGEVIRWLPVRAAPVHEIQDKTPEDIAVLELADELPPAAAPAPLLGLGPNDYMDRSVHCFGFPAGKDEGVPRSGTCRGENALGWVHLDLERGPVEGGFSGTGAWDPNRGAAVGLVVAARVADQSAYLIPARTLFAAWPELDGTWRPPNPYKGLAAFGAEDRADFFGRADLIPRLADRVRDQRLTTLIGPSGSGKSSLIGAGLIPELAEGDGWRRLVTRPGTDPFDELAARLIPRADLTLGQRLEERDRLRGLLADLPAGPVRVLREYLADAPGATLLLIIDQFEELFTNVQPAAPNKEQDQARDFVAALEALSDSDLPVRLVIAMRADFMGRAMEGPAAGLIRPFRQFQIGPLEGEALRDAIAGPARARGVRLAPGLVETILDAVADQPGRLPLLQFALTRLWEEQRARRIDAAALERIGGVRRALSDYADGIIDALTEADRIRARRILIQLVRPSQREDEAATRQVASFRRIPAQDRDLLPELARSRLIVTSRGPDDQPMAEIAHEALIREWERLGTWVAEDRSFRLWQEGLRGRMGEWETNKRHPGYLLTGPPLIEAEIWLAARPLALSQDDSGYIHTSRRRATRRARRVRGTVAAVILLLTAFGAVAWWQRQEAAAAAQRATKARQEAERLIDYMTFDLRRKLKPLGRLELLQDTQQRVDTYYERLGVQGNDPDMMRRRAANLLNSGDLQASLGNLAAAERLYTEGTRILERLAASDPSNAGWQRDLSVSLNKVGGIKAEQGDLAGALSAYEEAKRIAERLAESDPSNADWQRDLSVSLEKMGDIEAAQGDLAAALSAYEQSKSIREHLAATDPNNAGWQRDLSVSLNKVGDIEAKQGDLAAALSAYEQSKAIFERLAATDPSNAGWQLDLVVSLWRLSGEGLAEPQVAHGYLEQALEILEALEAAGRLHGEHRDWLDLVRQRLQMLDIPEDW